MKLLPLGSSDFKEVIDNDFYYIDKTLLIKELLETSGKILLIPRPRRFGKTLNLSMLKYFFKITKEKNANKYLFENTNIWKDEKYQNFLGKYPVVFITFKDVKEDSFEATYNKIANIIAEEFKHYSEILENSLGDDSIKFNKIKLETANEIDIHTSLKLLSKLLYKHFNQKVIILIDEYDAPIHAAYNKEYYDKAVNLIRGIFTSVFKDNDYLERGILTGITRVAKESIFSGLNNLTVCSILNTEFKDKFGFTQTEVEQLLLDQNLNSKLDDFKKWYNGYNFSGYTIYNPWSVLSCVKNKGEFGPYWVNTSSNDLIKKLIIKSYEDFKYKLEILLSDNSISEKINDGLVFPGIENDSQAIWNLLLFTGYLTYRDFEIKDEVRNIKYYNLVLPNLEIKILFEQLIEDILRLYLGSNKVNLIFEYLINGQIDKFAEIFQEYIINSLSYLDLSTKTPENSYHLFILGFLSLLSNSYLVKSNREYGSGKPDVVILPKDKSKSAIIMEFKKTDQEKNLQQTVDEALTQIKDRNYAHEIKDLGIQKIYAIGIAFYGKKTQIRYEIL